MTKDKEERKRNGLGGKIASNTWSATKWLARKTGKLFRDSVLTARPLNRKEQIRLSKLEEFMKPNELNRLNLLVKQGKAVVKLKKLDWSFLISGKDDGKTYGGAAILNWLRGHSRRFYGR